MRTPVCITIDTEFSIGGAFRDPRKYRPVGEQAVWCNIGGRSHGLGFILDTLEAHRLQGSFFVETFNACYFGTEAMGAIARAIAGRGHDVQLHTHPCWRHFRHDDWQRRLEHNPPNDSMAGRSREELACLLREALATFAAWGLPAPLALRTGNLQVDPLVYEAMAQTPLRLASNIGLAIYRPEAPSLQLYAGSHAIHGILETPVTTYTDLRLPGFRHYKTLTITGSSSAETRQLLWQARRRHSGPVVILTHPSEFVHHPDPQYRELHPHHLNQRRLRELCAFLDANRDAFAVTTFRSAAVFEEAAKRGTNPLLTSSPFMALRRILENRTALSGRAS